MYPRLAEWQAVRARVDPAGVLQSDLSRRLGLTAGAAERSAAGTPPAAAPAAAASRRRA
jgi:hypothetical protein